MHGDTQKNPIEALENMAISVTRWVGSIWSVIIHTLLFAGAFLLVIFGANCRQSASSTHNNRVS